MISMNISVAPADMAKFEASMKARAKRADGDMRVAVIRAALALTRTLGASTRVAGERRDVKFMPWNRAQRAAGFAGFAKGGSWGVLVYSQRGPPKLHRLMFDGPNGSKLYTYEREGALNSRMAKIKRRGLAKGVLWSWVKSLGAAPPDSDGQDISARFAAFKSSGMGGGSSADISVTLTDTLPYAMKAFKTTGRQAVNTAVRRAANILRHDAEGWAKKVCA